MIVVLLIIIVLILLFGASGLMDSVMGFVGFFIVGMVLCGAVVWFVSIVVSMIKGDWGFAITSLVVYVLVALAVFSSLDDTSTKKSRGR